MRILQRVIAVAGHLKEKLVYRLKKIGKQIADSAIGNIAAGITTVIILLFLKGIDLINHITRPRKKN